VVATSPGIFVSFDDVRFNTPDSSDPRYGAFMTGPSANADIEGVLIHGAHGIRTLTVVFARV